MATTRKQLRAGALAAALALGGVIAACGKDSVDIVAAPRAVNPIFQSYVALGNSITAGYQSGGIDSSTQKESYARLLAIQMGTRYAYAKLAGFGCPPPIVDYLTQARKGGTTTPCFLRDPASATRVLNNVAVPGATAIDPTAVTSPAANILTQLVLGGKTQVQKALDAQPTFVSVWIGNNDVLDAAVKGVTTAVGAPLLTPGITDTAAFRTRYTATISGLRTQPDIKGILIGVVNVTQIPVLFPAELLLTDTVFKRQFEAASGGAVGSLTVDPTCLGSGVLVSERILVVMRAGSHPRIVSCTKNSPAPPVGDWFILDAAEQATFNAVITRYNGYISAQATAAGFAYVDPNPLLAAFKATGQIPAHPDVTSATAPFGTFFSLDGIHPALPAHREIAKALITAINAKYSTSIPQLAP